MPLVLQVRMAPTAYLARLVQLVQRARLVQDLPERPALAVLGPRVLREQRARLALPGLQVRMAWTVIPEFLPPEPSSPSAAHQLRVDG